MVSRVIPVDPFDLVIFGGTGDLARRKILPGLYRRFLAGQMPPDSRIIGAARADLTEAAFRDSVRAAIAEFVPADRQDAAAHGHHRVGRCRCARGLVHQWFVGVGVGDCAGRSDGGVRRRHCPHAVHLI